MKKYLGNILVLMLFLILVKGVGAQNTCATAHLDTASNDCIEKIYYFNNSDVYWIKFVAASKHVLIRIGDSMQQINPINNIKLYSGNCNSLSLLKSNSTDFIIDDTTLLIGNDYYIRISQAQPNSNRFDLILKNSSSNCYPACVITSSNVICCGGSITFQNLTSPAPTGSNPNDRYSFVIGHHISGYHLPGPLADDFQTQDYYTLTIDGQACWNFLPSNSYTLPIHMFCPQSCDYYTTQTITVYPNPTINITPTNPSVILGCSTSLTASGATNYLWMPGNLSGSTVSVSPTSTTTYTVTGTSSLGSCTGSATVTVTVNPPQPSFTFGDLCRGFETHFYGSATCTNGVIQSGWSWDFGDGSTGSGQNVSHIYQSTGTFNVELTITDINGDNHSVVNQVTIQGAPTFVLTGTENSCNGSGTYYINPWSNTGTYTYKLENVPGLPVTIYSSPFTVYFPSQTYMGLLIVQYYDSITGCYSNDSVSINGCCGYGNQYVYGDGTFNNIPFPDYSTVYINGTMKINLSANTTITRVNFRMGENAKIVLLNNTQLTINNSKFTQGCDKMWDMIYVPQTTSKLTFNNDTLMDAINGVYSDNGGNIDLNTSLFKNNYRCVQIKRYGQSTGVNHPAHIAQCFFYGAASPNYLTCSPLTGKRSDAGIIVSDVGLCNTEYGATIGDSLNADKRNYFRSLIYGVIDSNSNVRVINNRFAKFYPAFVQNGITIYPTAIEAYSKKLVQQGQPLPKFTLNVGGNITNKINYIDTCNKGIHIARNISLKASYNSFKNGYMAIHYESNLQGNKVSINYNLITKFYYGIVSVLNNKCTSRIVRNWINSTNGIYAVGFDFNNTNESIIADYDSIHAYNCITYKTLYSPVSRCDTLKIKTYSSAPSAGLFVEGCNFHQSQNLKTYGASTNRSYGAYIVNSGDFRYICSYINNVDTAIQFVGYNLTNTEYSLMRNSLNNSDVGLTIFNNGNIGPSGSPSKPIFIAWNSVSARNWSISSPGANQVIYYNSSLGAYYNPLTDPSYYSGGGSAFTSSNISGTSNKSCPNCPTLTLGMSMVEAQIADSLDEKPQESVNSNQMLLQTYYTPLTYLAEITKGSFDFPMFNDNAKYIEKANAYTAICSDTAYFYTNTDLQNFKRQNDTSNIGKLYRVKKYFNTDSYSTAENLNNSINPRNVIEKLNKSVFGIMISFLTNDTLTGENIDSLRVYAYLCPLEYGNSVYNARALLTKVDSIGTTYISSCEGSTMVRSMITGNDNSNPQQENIFNSNGNERIKVYPNPAKDKLIVEYFLPDDNGDKQFELFDILGNKLKSVLLSGNIGSISISVEDLKEGMYLYRFISSNKIISYNKLVIIK